MFTSPFSKVDFGENKTVVNTSKPAGDSNNVSDVEKFFNSTDDGKKDKVGEKETKKPEDTKDKTDTKENEEDNEEVKVNLDDEEENTDKLDDEETEEETSEEDEEPEEKEEVNLAPPRKAEVLKAFPELFKKFPFFESMMYRDKRISDEFGSFDNIKEAFSTLDQFKGLETQLLSGDLSKVLTQIKSNDKEAYDKIIDNYLPLLEKNDPEAYTEIVQNHYRRVIAGMVTEAKDEQNEELYKAADELHKFVFNKSLKSWTDPTKRVKSEETSDENKKLQEERAKFAQERFEAAADGLEVKVNNLLTKTITDHIDPNGQMSKYEKDKAIKDTLEELHGRIGKDKTFQSNLNKYWRDSHKNNYSSETLDRIRKAYLGRANSDLSNVIKSIRAKVLKDKGIKPSDKNEVKETPRQRKTTAGRPQQRDTTAKERQKGESVESFFMRD